MRAATRPRSGGSGRKARVCPVEARGSDPHQKPDSTAATAVLSVLDARNAGIAHVLRAHRMAGKGSLIPSAKNYRQQLRVYEADTARAGLSKLHGLRHAYAQQRYHELTGWRAPAAGGPTAKSLAPEQTRIDQQARLTISQELGHERPQIVAVYCGA